MTWRTHISGGIASLWLLTLIPNGISADHLGLLGASATFGALLPDLDASDSKIKHLSVAGIKPLLLLATAIHNTFGHRGILHSSNGFGIFGVLILPLLLIYPWQLWAALMLGYGSHLVLDACTCRGIPLTHNLPRRVHLLPIRLRIVTGSPSEELVFVVSAISALAFLLVAA